MNAVLDKLLRARDLDATEASALFDVLVDTNTPPVVVGALLAALRLKGETGEEIRGLALAMRARALPCDLGSTHDLTDIVGTGGDGASSFNLSTGAALVAAAAGCRVAKHGGGAVSGRSGSADVLAAFGVKLPSSAAGARELFERTGFTFLEAPHFHAVLRGLAPLRRTLGTRTVFNLLGPLCNPASPRFAVIGAASYAAARAMAEALSGLPFERVFVVHGDRGWDEPTPTGPFQLFDVRAARVVAEEREPLRCGLPRCHPDDLRGGDPMMNALAMRDVFDGARGPHRDALVLGAALALEVSSRCRSMEEGVAMASSALARGDAARLLASIIAASSETAGGMHV
jgi:anthranilate phosphoribosyltransferase